MKTWEMIKELTENPKKKFRLIDNESDIKVTCSAGEIRWTGGDRLYIYDEWEEVKEPVDFIEAVKSGKKIRSVTWMQNTELDLPNLLYDMSDFDEEEIRQLLLDKWYIED